MNEPILSQDAISENEYLPNERYAGVLDRVKAIMIDSALILAAIVITSSVLSFLGDIPDFVRMICFLFIFLLYEPLFTVFRGGTLGQMIMGLRVKKEWDESKNINFASASVRYIIKILLGWFSLLTVSANTRKRAIHDQIAGSVVVYAKNN